MEEKFDPNKSPEVPVTQYYATVDKEGFCTAFYADRVHGENIPKEAFKITEEQWRRWITEQQKVKWDSEKEDLVEVELKLPEMKSS